MYTVLRFTFPALAASIADFQAKLTPNAAQLFDGPDAVPNRVSLGIAREDDWDEHLDSIRQFLSVESEVIQWAIDQGISLYLDTAVAPGDIPGLYGDLIFPHDLIQILASSQMELVVTLYKGA